MMPHIPCDALGQFDIQTMFDALLIFKSTFIAFRINVIGLFLREAHLPIVYWFFIRLRCSSEQGNCSSFSFNVSWQRGALLVSAFLPGPTCTLPCSSYFLQLFWRRRVLSSCYQDIDCNSHSIHAFHILRIVSGLGSAKIAISYYDSESAAMASRVDYRTPNGMRNRALNRHSGWCKMC